MFYYTYILLSKKDGKLYIGSSGNLIERIKAHNRGDVNSTKTRRPLELIYFEACRSKSKAIAREEYFKAGFGRKFIKNRI